MPRLVDPVDPVAVRPAVSSNSPLECMPSRHSLNWSLRLLSWSLIAVLFDHRNRPAAAAPAAAAAAAIGRSRAISMTPQSLYWLRPDGLLLRPPRPPRLLLRGISFSSDLFLSHPNQTIESAQRSALRERQAARRGGPAASRKRSLRRR